jgi:hypothetical protein
MQRPIVVFAGRPFVRPEQPRRLGSNSNSEYSDFRGRVTIRRNPEWFTFATPADFPQDDTEICATNTADRHSFTGDMISEPDYETEMLNTGQAANACYK